MSERATKEIKIGEHTLVVKTYCTGREFNEIEAVYMGGAKVKNVGADVQIESFKPTIQQDADNKMIEVLTVSLDGDPADILNRILDLPKNDYLGIVAALSEIAGKKKTQG